MASQGRGDEESSGCDHEVRITAGFQTINDWMLRVLGGAAAQNFRRLLRFGRRVRRATRAVRLLRFDFALEILGLAFDLFRLRDQIKRGSD